MIIDITNEVFTKLKTSIPTATLLTEYPSTTPVFPCIILSELSNNTNRETTDTGGEKHNEVSLEVNIFTNTTTKMSDAKAFRKSVDDVMSGFYGMERTFSNAVPNFSDTNIYRYVLRYTFIIDSGKKIHKRR